MAELKESLLQQIKDQGDLVRKLKAAKESTEKDMGSNRCYMDLETLDMYLSKCSYIGGYVPSKCDIDMIQRIGYKVDLKKYPYLKRWWHHMRSFSDSEISSFPTATSFDNPLNMMKYNNYEQKVCDMLCKVVAVYFDLKNDWGDTFYN